MNDKTSLSSSARLVELNISVVTGSKLDKRASDKVNTDNNAKDKVARVTKNIFAHSEVLPDIGSVASEARVTHQKMTLPWNDNGQRLIPNDMIIEHMQVMSEYRADFEKLVEDFKEELPTLREEAEQSLGSLYNPNDYPSTLETEQYISNKFKFICEYPQVPENGGFLNGVLEDVREDIEAGLKEGYDRKLKNATQDAWTRMAKCIERLSTQLTDRSDGKPRKLYASLLTNTKELCDNLKHFNLTDDPKLEDARLELWKIIERADIDDLRDKDWGYQARQDMKDKVDDVKASVDEIPSKFNF